MAPPSPCRFMPEPPALRGRGRVGRDIASCRSAGRRSARAAALWAFLGVAVAAGAGLPDAAHAVPPDQISIEIGARLAGLAVADAAPQSRGLDAATLIATADLPGLAALRAADAAYGPALAPILDPLAGGVGALTAPVLALPRTAPAMAPDAPPPRIARLPLRLALTMLSQAHGDDDNGAVLLAQSDPTGTILVLQGGQADLSALAALVAAEGRAALLDGQRLTLQVPLVIWPEAGLRLGPGEELLLSRADGAFVMNFGTLTLDGAAIRGTPEPNPAVRRFRPFVTTADGGHLIMRGAEMSGLGFGTSLKFAGVSVLRSLLTPGARPADIAQSRFDDVLSLALVGDSGARILGNRFHDARGPALVVARSSGVLVQGNLFSGQMPTNAIRIEAGSPGGIVTANVILGGERTGITVRGDSPDALVAGNVVWDRSGGGIAILDSACARVAGNLVIANDQKEIELRAAPGGSVIANSVLSNDSIAIWISDQTTTAETRIADNVIAFNGAGLAAAQGGPLVATGNDLTRQYQQFISGDLVAMAKLFARDMLGRDDIRIVSGGMAAAAPGPEAQGPTCGG